MRINKDQSPIISPSPNLQAKNFVSMRRQQN